VSSVRNRQAYLPFQTPPPRQKTVSPKERRPRGAIKPRGHKPLSGRRKSLEHVPSNI